MDEANNNPVLALENGCPWNKKTCTHARLKGYSEVLNGPGKMAVPCKICYVT